MPDRIYYHVSPANNVFPILTQGIQQSYAQTKRGGMYLVTKSNIDWAIKHTCQRHGVRKVVVIPVYLPRRWSISGKLKHGFRRGVWKCLTDIAPKFLGEAVYHG